ncbi:MAG: DUF975 family protein [Lachnospiraceae bacterium]|uniref:DUF975 family protein n=1 Tax=Parablautia sp. Marseille-Q6255 TaxID=3039593 RepID=UPI0024BCFFFD|nr:DUF975 family protein [Parablautia sp. Marseille-Q6255]
MKTTNRELKFHARVLLSGKTGFLVLTTLLITFFDFGLDYIVDAAILPTGGLFNQILYYGCGLLCNMVYYILFAGLMHIYLNICRGRQVKISDLFCVFSDRPEQIAIYSILQYILSMVLSISMQWSLSGILYAKEALLPFIIVPILLSVVNLWIQLCLTPVLFLYCDDPSKTAVQLVRESWSLMRGSKGKLFFLEFSFIGLMILGMLSLGIGFLFVRPYLFLSQALFYLNLRDRKDSQAE